MTESATVILRRLAVGSSLAYALTAPPEPLSATLLRKVLLLMLTWRMLDWMWMLDPVEPVLPSNVQFTTSS